MRWGGRGRLLALLVVVGAGDQLLLLEPDLAVRPPGLDALHQHDHRVEHLLGARDEILARVERLLASPGREREAGKLAQVALRILPGDPKAASLLAKARSSSQERTS